jgi:hypothetical protein
MENELPPDMRIAAAILVCIHSSSCQIRIVNSSSFANQCTQAINDERLNSFMRYHSINVWDLLQ